MTASEHAERLYAMQHALAGNHSQRRVEVRPRISVIMATKNRAYWIRRAVDTVVTQDIDDWQLVICDGGDDPGLTADQLPDDPRIVHHWQPNSGPAEGFQIALDHASGEIITPLADDDRLAPCFSYVDQWFGVHPEQWAYGITQVVNQAGDELYRLGEPFDLNRLRQSYYLGGAVYWRKTLTDKLGGFDPGFDGAADYELYLRFAKDSKPGFWRRICYLYTDHPGTDSHVNSARQEEAAARIKALA